MKMTIVYSIMWLGIALFLLRLGIKEQKIYLIFSVYFLFNSIWWAIKFFTAKDVFHGMAGWIYRGVTAVFLVIGCIYYYNYTKKKGDNTN